MKDRPDEIDFGTQGDIAKDIHAGNIKSRQELKHRSGLGGYIAPKSEHLKEEGMIMDKADQIGMIPLFLAAEYKKAFDKSNGNMADDDEKNSDVDSEQEKENQAELKKKMKASKLYRSQFFQKKMAEQSERLKKMRKEGRKPGPAGGGAKRKGKEKGFAEETAELESLVEELKSEAHFKDEEFREMNEELDRLRKQNDHLRKANKAAVVKTQLLESSKTQEAVMKELLENHKTIQDGSFFDLKRDEGKNKSSTLLSQLVEQRRNTQKMGLAMKYGMRWLNKTRQARKDREDAQVRLYDQ